MAIDTAYRDADNFARAQKSFYGVRIPVSHWQLRHYISHPEPDHLYYASGHDVFCVHTPSKKRKRIATLPFEARCTAAGHGWVCVGGEDEGHFAAIKLDGGSASVRNYDVDSVLPLGGNANGRAGTYVDDEWKGRRAVTVRIERIGEEIMNSISIHRITDEEDHLDDIVAVLTNNDKTVRVYSLPSRMETAVLDLPFAMNHATISPDGHTLIAVGDVNEVHFFSRETVDEPPQIHKPHNRLTSESLEWRLDRKVPLHHPSGTMGYFTTAWAPSGRLVAVGSEGGYIQVFDMAMLADPESDDEEAIVATMAGSRPDLPHPHPGAVRSILFAPEPWDLLIWAEDQGRVCIGDLRTGLQTRQVITLNPKEEGLNRIPLEDVPAEGGMVEHVLHNPGSPRDLDDLEAEFLRRYRHAPDNATAVNFATEYIEARRRQRQSIRQRQDLASMQQQNSLASLGEDDPGGLTVREQQILETLRTSRQREEARSGAGTAPRGVNYTTRDMFRNSPRDGSETPERPPGDILRHEQDSFPELSRTTAAATRPGSSHGAETSDQSLEQTLLSNADSELAAFSIRPADPRPRQNTPGARNFHDLPTTESGFRPHRTMDSSVPGTDDNNPWRTIEDHMALPRNPLYEGPAPRTTATSTRVERPFDLTRDDGISWPMQVVEPDGPGTPSRPLTAADRVIDPARLQEQRTRSAQLRASLEASHAAERARNRRRYAAAAQASSHAEQLVLQRTQNQQARSVVQVSGGGGGLAGQILGLGRDVGVRTAGLAISADGRVLWVACEEGVFEMELGLRGRMFWPSLGVR